MEWIGKYVCTSIHVLYHVVCRLSACPRTVSIVFNCNVFILIFNCVCVRLIQYVLFCYFLYTLPSILTVSREKDTKMHIFVTPYTKGSYHIQKIVNIIIVIVVSLPSAGNSNQCLRWMCVQVNHLADINESLGKTSGVLNSSFLHRVENMCRYSAVLQTSDKKKQKLTANPVKIHITIFHC